MARSRRQPRPRSQRGFSLVETLVAVVVASIWVLAIVTGLLVVTRADATSASRQGISGALSGYTAALKELPYLPCGAGSGPSVAAYTSSVDSWADRYAAPVGYQVRITRVEPWDGGSAGFVASCPSVDGAAQRLTVEASGPDGQSATAQVVKAQP